MHMPVTSRSLRKFALWAALAVSIPGALFALIVALPRIPIALMFGLDSFRIPTLYLIYFSGMAAGTLCLRAVRDGNYLSGANYGLRTILSALGMLAAGFLEYYFRNDRFPLIPGGYLLSTAVIWVLVAATAWRGSARSPATRST
jgi:hypothetical protein